MVREVTALGGSLEGAWRYRYDGSRIIEIQRRTLQHASGVEAGLEIGGGTGTSATGGESLPGLLESWSGGTGITPVAPWTIETVIVYGFDYVDEPVAIWRYSSPTSAVLYFVMRDGNYNVTGLVDVNGNLVDQYSFDPYGNYLAAETAAGQAINWETTILKSPFGHQGLLYLPEIKCYHNRARIYSPTLGRFLQRDPNDTALILYTAMRMNAENAVASLLFSAGGLYGDGMNLYQYLRGNPLRGNDPLGLFDPFIAVDDAIYSLYADNVAFGQWALEKMHQIAQGVFNAALTTAAFGVAGALCPVAAVAGGLALSAAGIVDGLRDMWEAKNITFSGTLKLVGGWIGFKNSFNWLSANVGVPESWGLLKPIAGKLQRRSKITYDDYFKSYMSSNEWYKVQNNWKGNKAQTIYHWEKHAKKFGLTLEEYTDDAIAFWHIHKHEKFEFPIDGGVGYKIDGIPGGIYTADGKIVTFWYD
ncbi:MAG: hypothetical protein HJJLKODD_00972 [Phycisphaerae bacterium]|nr:hypothetical protein [Phycisphaerae bacterium]